MKKIFKRTNFNNFVANLPLVSPTLVKIGGKFDTSVVDAGGAP
jgi:hypothetical protein